MSLFRTKPINNDSENSTGLHRCLTGFDLILLGVGAIIGAGVFVLTGVAAATKAGPAIILSYAVSGVACSFAALAYAELSTSVGGCGSAYGYAYAGFGEIIAWIIGWDLLLEYGVGVSAVAIGWSGYVNNALTALGYPIPSYFLNGPFEKGFFNIPAAMIILLIAGLLALGVKASSRANAVMVFIKLLAIIIFITFATAHVNFANWHPFMPFGWSGVMGGAALIFFAYIGFDATSTAVEETINPQRNLPIGIIGSLLVCTIIYIVVSGLLTAIVPYTTLNMSSPVAQVLLNLGHRYSAAFVAVGAIAGLTTVILVMFYGLTRVFFAVSRDGLLPQFFSKLNPNTKTPVRIIMLSGLAIALLSGFVPMEDIAHLVNIGTLAAFVLVCAGVLMLRYKHPNLPRTFKTPFGPLIPVLGMASCIYLMASLPLTTWLRFIIWLAIGAVVYFGYGRANSKLAVTKPS